MVPIMSLLLPVVLSAVFVFIVSAIIHMVLPYHRNDFKKLPDEDGVMDALRKFNIPPGDYFMPLAGSMKAMNDPAFVEKYKKGPVATMTVMPGGAPTMSKELVLWFIYCLAVSVCAAYLAGRALGPGAPYLAVFRFAGFGAFLAYSFALIQTSIWYKRSWSTTIKSMFDGLIYGLVTAGTFGWLWPAM